MNASPYEPARPSRLRLLLERFSRIEDKRSPEDVAHKLNEILLLCVCATIAECDSFEAIADWGNDHLGFLRRFLPFDWGVPSGRWINIMMNRIDPDLFAACFMDWVRACWPEPPDTIAIDGKTVRRSHDRSRGRAALHLVSAFATNSRLVLGQEAVDDKTNETTVIPLLLEKLAAGRSLEGALVTIDAIACNPHIAQSIRDAGADYLLAVKGNQPTLQADIEAAFETAEKGQVEIDVDLDKGHGRIETRTVSVLRQVDWLDGDRRFPGEVRFVDARAIVRVEARTELKDRSRFDARYYITSSVLSAAGLSQTIRGHWGIENTLRWTLDVTFQEDFSRVRKGHGAKTWRSCASSPSISCAPPRHSATPPTSPSSPAAGQPSRPDPKASSSAEKSRAGTSTGSPKSS
jgi:predicted transposase YbfD/YdcC